MSHVTTPMRDVARRLIVCEAKGKKSADPKGVAAFMVCERLRPQLAVLMGNAGYRALLGRSLALAQGEVAWLRALRVKADGSLEGVDPFEAPGAEEFLEGRVVLLAQLLELLVAFIGERLTSRLVGEAFPNVSLNGQDKGFKYEKKR